MPSVLFVCLGNICRSPAAHGAFLTVLEREKLSATVRVDSAGTGDWHIGRPPDKRMTKAAHNRGIDLTPLRARQVTRQDFDEFDHIFAMDQDNLRVMQTLAQDRRTQPQLYLDLIAPGKQQEVPDPYYGGAAGFEHVLDLVERASQALIARLKDI